MLGCNYHSSNLLPVLLPLLPLVILGKFARRLLKVYEQEATELGGCWRYFRLLKVDRNDCCALLLLLSLLGFIAGWVLVLMPPTLPPNCQYAHGSIHEASKSSACLACCMCLHWNPTAAKECGYRQCSNSSSDDVSSRCEW